MEQITLFSNCVKVLIIIKMKGSCARNAQWNCGVENLAFRLLPDQVHSNHMTHFLNSLREARKTLTGALFQQASCLIAYHLFFCSQHKHIYGVQCALVNLSAVPRCVCAWFGTRSHCWVSQQCTDPALTIVALWLRDAHINLLRFGNAVY